MWILLHILGFLGYLRADTKSVLEGFHIRVLLIVVQVEIQEIRHFVLNPWLQLLLGHQTFLLLNGLNSRSVSLVRGLKRSLTCLCRILSFPVLSEELPLGRYVPCPLRQLQVLQLVDLLLEGRRHLTMEVGDVLCQVFYLWFVFGHDSIL